MCGICPSRLEPRSETFAPPQSALSKRDWSEVNKKDLFQEDKCEQEKATIKFQNYIDKVMSTSFGPGLLAPNVYAYAPPQTFCDARHEEICKDIKGKVTKCGSDNEIISPNTLINHSLVK